MIKNLQALRAIAALLVVCVHLDILLGSLGLKTFGAGGVDLFFVISGFVMVHTTKNSPPGAMEFMTNRIARIVPIYWLMTFGVFALALAAPSLLQSTRADPVELVKSLLFIPFEKPNGRTEPTLFVGWTLNYEMFFYGLFALGLAFRRYLLGIYAVAWFLVALVGVGVLDKSLGAVPAFYTSPKMLEFVFGMAIGLYIDRAPKSAPQAMQHLMLAAVGFCLPTIVIAPLLWPDVPSVITCGLPATVVVSGAILLERWGVKLENPSVMALGDASYVIYLSHPFVTQIGQAVGRKLETTGLASITLIVLTYAAVMLVGLVLHRWIEKPLSKTSRRLLATRPMKPQPA